MCVPTQVSRAVLTFGRSRDALLLALIGLSPFGEAVLSTGIYTVALKKLTTPATRGFAFGVQRASRAEVCPRAQPAAAWLGCAAHPTSPRQSAAALLTSLLSPGKRAAALLSAQVRHLHST